MSDYFLHDRRKNRDRRGSPRVAAEGPLWITIDFPATTTVETQLVESSSSGFRVTHQSSALEPGLEVRYRSATASGRARIIWTHVAGGRRVSGFILL